jgi:hypothetical protein
MYPLTKRSQWSTMFSNFASSKSRPVNIRLQSRINRLQIDSTRPNLFDRLLQLLWLLTDHQKRFPINLSSFQYYADSLTNISNHRVSCDLVWLKGHKILHLNLMLVKLQRFCSRTELSYQQIPVNTTHPFQNRRVSPARSPNRSLFLRR